MASVSFKNADIKAIIQDKQKLKSFIPALFFENKKSLQSLTIISCSDEYLLSLNKQFLQHDYYTDILTFDLSIDDLVSAEVYISIDRVKENAALVNISYNHEFQRIVFHGILHLCGFRDKTPLQKRKMTQKENEAIKKFAAFHVKQ